MVMPCGRWPSRRSCASPRPLSRPRSISWRSAPATRPALASATANAYPALLQALLRKKGINANVTNAGVNGDVTSGMLGASTVPYPRAPTLSFCSPAATICAFSAPRSGAYANVAAMTARLRARRIRVIVYDPDPVPPDFYQWDHIHFNAAAHAKIAATLAAQISAQVAASPKPASATAFQRSTPAATAGSTGRCRQTLKAVLYRQELESPVRYCIVDSHQVIPARMTVGHCSQPTR